MRDVVVAEAGGELERGHLRDVQDLVAVGVADARDQRLVAQSALDLSAGPGEYRRERVPVEGGDERFGPEACHPGYVRRIVHQMDGQALGGAHLGQVEAVAAGEDRPQRERALARPWRGGGKAVLPLKPAGPREVDEQMKLPCRDVEELPVPGHGGHGGAFERGGRRVVRLQDVDRERQDAGDLPADQMVVEEVPQGFDFRQFGHDSSLPQRPRACLPDARRVRTAGSGTGLAQAVDPPRGAREDGPLFVVPEPADQLA